MEYITQFIREIVDTISCTVSAKRTQISICSVSLSCLFNARCHGSSGQGDGREFQHSTVLQVAIICNSLLSRGASLLHLVHLLQYHFFAKYYLRNEGLCYRRSVLANSKTDAPGNRQRSHKGSSRIWYLHRPVDSKSRWVDKMFDLGTYHPWPIRKSKLKRATLIVLWGRNGLESP